MILGFGGLDREIPLETTCRAARAGLEVFGLAARATYGRSAHSLPRCLPRAKRGQGGFYELLLILADAVSQSPAAEPAQRAEEALRIVDRAEGLRSQATRAYHLRRAASWT